MSIPCSERTKVRVLKGDRQLQPDVDIVHFEHYIVNLQPDVDFRRLRALNCESPNMANWRPDFDPAHLYFVTTTAVQSAYIFRRDVVKRILVDGLYYLYVVGRTEVYAFVIMPNHVHVIIRCGEEDPLKDVVRDFKANMARLIVRQYQVERNQQVLDFLRSAVIRPEKQRFKVWEDGYVAKDVFSPDFLLQKMEYIHNNPLQPRWRLAEHAEDYVWSSARFYLLNEPALIPLSDARELF